MCKPSHKSLATENFCCQVHTQFSLPSQSCWAVLSPDVLYTVPSSYSKAFGIKWSLVVSQRQLTVNQRAGDGGLSQVNSRFLCAGAQHSAVRLVS